MKVLLVHQNFPGQFKHLGPALARRGDEVHALTMNNNSPVEGVKTHVHSPSLGTSSRLAWAQDFETKLLRAESAYRKARELRASGFIPDVIVGHMGWGDMLFLKDVWPGARVGVYCEYFYSPRDGDAYFDPEFPGEGDELDQAIRLKLKAFPQRLHFEVANRGLSPMAFQASTYPQPFRSKISVIHDGIDTGKVAPSSADKISANGRVYTAEDEIITFVSRTLEPYRGYHTFMRSLPELLARRPRATVFIVGKTTGGYGATPPHSTWKDIFLDEVKGSLDMSRVIFTGPLSYDAFLALLKITSLHVYLTYPFVLSWSLLEAMALERPILGSATAPVQEVIEDGANGILTDFFNAQELAIRAAEILAQPMLQKSLGCQARQFVIEHYDLRSKCLPAQLAWVDGLAEEVANPPIWEPDAACSTFSPP